MSWGFLTDPSAKHNSTRRSYNSPRLLLSNTAFGRVLILVLVSNKNLEKVFPLISLMIIGALRSLFLIERVFIMIELIVSLNWILLGLLWVLQMPLKNLTYEGICLTEFINVILIMTFWKASSR